MAATDLGKVGIVMKGAYNSANTYEMLDAVTYNSGTYIAKQAVPANTLPSNTTYWQAALVTDSVDVTSEITNDLPVGNFKAYISGNVMQITGTSPKYEGTSINLFTVPQKYAPKNRLTNTNGGIIPAGSADKAKLVYVSIPYNSLTAQLNGFDNTTYGGTFFMTYIF